MSIVILWRKDTSHVKYEWITDKWEVENDLNYTTQKLENTISRLLKSSEALTYEAFVKDLFDEHSKGIFSRIFTKIVYFIESTYEEVGKKELLAVASILGTILFIVVVGYIMMFLVYVLLIVIT